MTTRDKLLNKIAEIHGGNEDIPTRHRYKDITLKSPDSLGVKNPVASVKYDGASYFLSFDNQGNPRYISRRKSVTGDIIEKTRNVPHLADFQVPSMAGKTFNLELYHSGKEFGGHQKHPVATGILNSLPARAIETQKQVGPLRAAIFDVIDPNIKTYGEKLEIIDTLTKSINKPELFHAAERKVGIDGIRELNDRTKSQGLEGIIVTSLTEPEDKNPRLKTKHYGTHNLRVSRITQEIDKDGNPKDSAGALIVIDGAGREVANVGTGLSHALRKEIWRNPKAWINRLIQVKGYPTTAHRIRSPVYNGDADGTIDTI